MIIRDIRGDDRGGLYSGRMYSELFGCEIDAALFGCDAEYLEFADKCAEYFNNLPEELLALLKKYSLRYCEDMRDWFDRDSPEVPEDVNENTVLDYVRVSCIIIEKPKAKDSIGFGVEFLCDWEREHGMEWTIRDGRALYVGDFMGISPWYSDSVYETQCRSYVYDDFSL